MGISVPTEPLLLASPSRSNLNEVDRHELIFRFSVAIAFLMGLVTISLAILAVIHPIMQYISLAAAFGGAWLVVLLAVFRGWKSDATRIYMLLASFSAMMLALAVFAKGQEISTALINLAFGILVASFASYDTTSGRAITLSIASSWVISLAGLILPVEKVSILWIDIAMPSFIGIFAMIYLTLLAMEWISATLRVRLILGALAIVIIPLFTNSSIQSIMVQNSVTERLRGSLSSSALQVSEKVDDWLANNLDLISREAAIPIFAEYLALPPQDRKNSPQERDLLLSFRAMSKLGQQYLTSFGLLDNQGVVEIDTNLEEIGKTEKFIDLYNLLKGRNYVSDVSFDLDETHPSIFFASPIFDNQGNFLGILRAEYDAHILQYLLEESTGLSGPVTYPILVDDNQLRIGDADNAANLYKTLAPLPGDRISALKSDLRIPDIESDRLSTQLTEFSNTLIYNPDVNFTSVRFNPEDNSESSLSYVAIARLVTKPWIVLYTQSAVAFTQLADAQGQTTILFSVFLAGIVGLAAIVIANTLTQPIARLTKTAERITTGDLSVNAPISNDEIGVLANAFNVMTTRLRQFINELETRVAERTRELAQRNDALTIRNRQIQTISEVTRAIASTYEVETLLTMVTELVSERFGFYHVGIFLVDDKHEYAVLRAANSEGGKRMLARQHKLSIGQVGIVGYVTSTGLPRIATDVGTDAVYFDNPDLPSTRSEMALPLLSGGQVIGAFDVQSTQANAFSQENVELFATLADQIAIALFASRTFEETQRALEEARLVHQQYLRQEWNREAQEQIHMTYEFTPKGVVARERIVSPEIDQIFANGQAQVYDASRQVKTGDPASMGIPIKLRGETIGIIHIEDQNVDREWAVEEIETVQSIADQVAQALENARLFEQTVRRAQRERKVLDITSKIRSTTDPQKMLQIAVEELQLALRASKAQVILNPVNHSASVDSPSNNGATNGGNGKSGSAKG
jgi:GAF domain-containing protein/HAMP domain-containing protein